MLLFGEILGASLCLPRREPTKKAAESLSQTDPITPKVRSAPSTPASHMRMITMHESMSEV